MILFRYLSLIFVILLLLENHKEIIAQVISDMPISENDELQKEDPYEIGLYFRIMSRYDFGANSSTLGWWPLYGRLLNETPWIKLDLDYDIIKSEKKGGPKATVWARLEGGSVRNADDGIGNLNNYRITQFNLATENTPWQGFVMQAGTIWYNMGYIGIYDFYVSQLFYKTIGFRVGQISKNIEYHIGIGDAGYSILQDRKNALEQAGHYFGNLKYNTIPTIGGLTKINLYKFNFMDKLDWLGYIQLGVGFELFIEPKNQHNPVTPHQTPEFTYDSVFRKKAIRDFIVLNSGQANNFPIPEAVSASSWRFSLWVGFALNLDLGTVKIKWNDLSFFLEKRHPWIALSDESNSIKKDIYVSNFTDEIIDLWLIDEVQLVLWKKKLDMNIGFALIWSHDGDNLNLPNNNNRIAFSVITKPQYYITREIHILSELSLAVEKSTIGNQYREHWDSIQSNTNGVPNKDGKEWGDTNQKFTFQFKIGPVFNFNGYGINTRPSIRVLYGVQYSNVHAAFGNTFNESLNRQNLFLSRQDMHLHHIISFEAEHWFGSRG